MEAINSLGIIYFQRKQYVDAERYFRKAHSLDDDAFEPLLNLGGVLLTQGKSKEALEVNQRAFQAVPQDALASAQLGLSYFLTGDNGQAIRYLDQAKELDPSHFTFPQITLAQIFMRLGQPEDAIEELEEFIGLHPDAPDIARARDLRQAADEAIRNKQAVEPGRGEF
jgi:tetratricopeptide (TPR) repeat protein